MFGSHKTRHGHGNSKQTYICPTITMQHTHTHSCCLGNIKDLKESMGSGQTHCRQALFAKRQILFCSFLNTIFFLNLILVFSKPYPYFILLSCTGLKFSCIVFYHGNILLQSHMHMVFPPPPPHFMFSMHVLKLCSNVGFPQGPPAFFLTSKEF